MKQLEREILQLAEKVRRVDGLELMTTSSAATLLKTSRKWVRENLPVVVLGQKGRRVRVADVEAFQSRRTVLPNPASLKLRRTSPAKNGGRPA